MWRPRRQRPPTEAGTRTAFAAVRLTVHVAEPHVRGRRSALEEVVRRAAAAGILGGTVVGAQQGFGRRHNHEPTWWRAADETPLTFVVVDTAPRVAAVLALLDELLPDAVAVTEPVRAVHYGPPAADRSSAPGRRP